MTEQADDALVLMDRAVASRDPLDLALAGSLSAYKGRTFDKQCRVIKPTDWCLQNDLPPLTAKRPHIELFADPAELLDVGVHKIPRGVPFVGLVDAGTSRLRHARAMPSVAPGRPASTR